MQSVAESCSVFPRKIGHSGQSALHICSWCNRARINEICVCSLVTSNKTHQYTNTSRQRSERRCQGNWGQLVFLNSNTKVVWYVLPWIMWRTLKSLMLMFCTPVLNYYIFKRGQCHRNDLFQSGLAFNSAVYRMLIMNNNDQGFCSNKKKCLREMSFEGQCVSQVFCEIR